MVRQPQIIVCAQIQHWTLIEQTNVGLLRRINRSFRLKESLAANRFQFCDCVFEKCGQETAPTVMIRERVGGILAAKVCRPQQRLSFMSNFEHSPDEASAGAIAPLLESPAAKRAATLNAQTRVLQTYGQHRQKTMELSLWRPVSFAVSPIGRYRFWVPELYGSGFAAAEDTLPQCQPAGS